MALKIKKGTEPAVAIDMTPMIDIVFQLLSFFIFTLKITTQEGDFNIKMPAKQQQGTPDPNQAPPITVRLRATTDGSCAAIIVNPNTVDGTGGTPLGNNGWQQLRLFIADQVSHGSQASAFEVTIDADYNLDYENVIKCITAVSGERSPDGHITKLVEKIKFAQPRPPGG